jgi:hypothetical protein
MGAIIVAGINSNKLFDIRGLLKYKELIKNRVVLSYKRSILRILAE